MICWRIVSVKLNITTQRAKEVYTIVKICCCSIYINFFFGLNNLVAFNSYLFPYICLIIKLFDKRVLEQFARTVL